MRTQLNLIPFPLLNEPQTRHRLKDLRPTQGTEAMLRRLI